MINTTPCIVGLCHENEKYTLKKNKKNKWLYRKYILKYINQIKHFHMKLINFFQRQQNLGFFLVPIKYTINP